MTDAAIHNNALETRELAKRYRIPWRDRTIDAVNKVSLAVPAGITFGLLGPNGAGKTTLIKMLLGMTTPSSGDAKIFGSDCRRREARASVGYLPEGGQFPEYHTGRSFLRFHGQLAGLTGAELDQRVNAVLAQVEMRSWDSLRLAKYSKGMLQRIGIAQALLSRPRLLILDEPTDGVDPVGRAQIRELIGELNRQGVTVFLNSHILAEVELYCHRVAILDRGRVILEGDVNELTHSPGFSIHCESPKGDLPKGLDHYVSQRPTALVKYPDGRVRWHVDVASRDDLNNAIDLLRRHAAEIESVAKNQNTLEQVFLRVIKGEDLA